VANSEDVDNGLQTVTCRAKQGDTGLMGITEAANACFLLELGVLGTTVAAAQGLQGCKLTGAGAVHWNQCMQKMPS
jgi:hypothetical protein